MMRSSGFMRCVAIVATIFSFAICGASAQPRSDEENPLAVPKVNLDGDGFFTIDDCPTTHDVLEVDLYEGEFAINMVLISVDGLPMTTIPIDEKYGVTRSEVHFLDANFDGNVDILVGPGCNREYSVLILWDNERNEYLLASNDGFVVFNGYFFFDPQNKVVYRMTSSSAFEATYTKMTWFGSDLQTEVNFLQVFDPSYYDSYRVTHRYTVRNYYSDEDIISTDDPNEIFAPWSKWLVGDEQ